eukprot:403369696
MGGACSCFSQEQKTIEVGGGSQQSNNTSYTHNKELESQMKLPNLSIIQEEKTERQSTASQLFGHDDKAHIALGINGSPKGQDNVSAQQVVKNTSGKKQKLGMEPNSVQSIQMIDIPQQNKMVQQQNSYDTTPVVQKEPQFQNSDLKSQETSPAPFSMQKQGSTKSRNQSLASNSSQKKSIKRNIEIEIPKDEFDEDLNKNFNEPPQPFQDTQQVNYYDQAQIIAKEEVNLLNYQEEQIDQQEQQQIIQHEEDQSQQYGIERTESVTSHKSEVEEQQQQTQQVYENSKLEEDNLQKQPLVTDNLDDQQNNDLQTQQQTNYDEEDNQTQNQTNQIDDSQINNNNNPYVDNSQLQDQEEDQPVPDAQNQTIDEDQVQGQDEEQLSQTEDYPNQNMRDSVADNQYEEELQVEEEQYQEIQQQQVDVDEEDDFDVEKQFDDNFSDVQRVRNDTITSSGTQFNRVNDGGSVYSDTDFRRVDDGQSDTEFNRVGGGSQISKFTDGNEIVRVVRDDDEELEDNYLRSLDDPNLSTQNNQYPNNLKGNARFSARITKTTTGPNLQIGRKLTDEKLQDQSNNSQKDMDDESIRKLSQFDKDSDMNFKDNQSDFDNRFENGQYDGGQDRGSSYYKKDGMKNHLGRQDRTDTQMSNFVNNKAFDDASDTASNIGGARNSAYVNNQAFSDDEDDMRNSKANAVNNRNDSD